MDLLLEKISSSIPDPSKRVKYFFDQAVADEKSGSLYRLSCATTAIFFSTINTVGYGVATASRIPIALIYRDLSLITEQATQDALNVRRSLYFIAAMTFYVFMFIFQRPGYALHLPPPDPYLQMPEAVASHLLAREDLTIEAQELKFDHFTIYLQSGCSVDINDTDTLQKSTQNRPDLVWITDKNGKLFLVKRDATIRRLVLDKKLSYCNELPKFSSPSKNEFPPQTEPVSIPVSISHNSQSGDLGTSKQELEASFNNSFILVSSKIGPEAPPPSTLFHKITTRIASVYKSFQPHIMKEMKYRHIMAQMQEMVIRGEGLALYNQAYNALENFTTSLQANKDLLVEMGTTVGLIQKNCSELFTLLTQRKEDIEMRSQYQEFILRLREAQSLVKKMSDELEIFNKGHHLCKKRKRPISLSLSKSAPLDPMSVLRKYEAWVHFLAMARFGGIELYDYCRELVQTQTKTPSLSISLENFTHTLKSIGKKVMNLTAEESISLVAQTKQRLEGHYNVKDFLIASNVPYIHSKIGINTRIVTILRHGTPINQNALSGTLEVTSDYHAFIEGAKKQGKNILHIIFENGVPKSETYTQKLSGYLPQPLSRSVGSFGALLIGGDESGRTQERLKLGDQHTNFYPLAFRLDGSFVQPHNFQSLSIEEAQKSFKQEMFGENTGYCVPEKLRQSGSLSEKDFQNYMNEVCNTFFKNKQNFETLEEFQAFVVLTYAEIALSLCQRLKIDFLEAFCKDDIDRGGAIKAVILLLHLYKSGMFDESRKKDLDVALEAIMINLVAAPLIIRKDQIIESRANYVVNVIHLLKEVVKTSPKPEKIYAGTFTTASRPHQGIYPLGPTCETAEEYQTYLESVKNRAVDLTTAIEENLLQKIGHGKHEEEIDKQLKRDIVGLNMFLNGERINPNRQEEVSSIKEKIVKTLGQANIENGVAKSILMTFTQTIGSDLVTALQPLFNNEWLGYILLPDSEKLKTDPEAGLYLTVDKEKASIKLVTRFKVMSQKNPDNTIANIQTTVEIPDHTTGKATITTTIL